MNRQSDPNKDLAGQGRRVALFLAATGVYWIVITWAGSQLAWTQRTRGLFDLVALAAFGWCLWMIIGIWRKRQQD